MLTPSITARRRLLVRRLGLVLGCLLVTTVLVPPVAGASAPARGSTPNRSAAAAASSDDYQVCGVHDQPVAERDTDDVTSVWLTPGQSISVTATGSIWAGYWLTGSNGPEGWSSAAGTGYPLPGARAFSLLARVGPGAWRYVGRGPTTVTNAGSQTARVELRTNDNVPGNGSGSFVAHYTLCDMSQAPVSQYAYPLWLEAHHSSKCAGVVGASQASGADVVQQTCSRDLSQHWTPRPGGGYYQLVGAKGGNCLTVFGSGNASDVRQQTCRPGDTTQQWSFVSLGTAQGWTEIVSRSNGRCLDVEAISTADGANVFTWDCLLGSNQQWWFTSAFLD